MMDLLTTRMHKVLRAHEVKVATAESCTGGIMAKMLTDYPGSSYFYAGGAVTYSNEMKAKMLGIPIDFINKYGAVSSEVARAMSKGIYDVSGADYGAGITGIAGPGEATRRYAVGVVFISIYNGKEYSDTKLDLSDNGVIHERDFIRDFAARKAIGMLLDLVEKDKGKIDDEE